MIDLAFYYPIFNYQAQLIIFIFGADKCEVYLVIKFYKLTISFISEFSNINGHQPSTGNWTMDIQKCARCIQDCGIYALRVGSIHDGIWWLNQDIWTWTWTWAQDLQVSRHHPPMSVVVLAGSLSSIPKSKGPSMNCELENEFIV